MWKTKLECIDCDIIKMQINGKWPKLLLHFIKSKHSKALHTTDVHPFIHSVTGPSDHHQQARRGKCLGQEKTETHQLHNEHQPPVALDELTKPSVN